MKKSITVIIAFVLLISVVLFGCSKNEDGGNTAGDQTTVSGQDSASVQQSTSQQSLADKYPSQSAGDTATTEQNSSETTAQSSQQDVTKESNANQSSTNPSVPSSSTNPSTPSAPSEPATPPSSTDKNGAYRIEKYQKIFESGTYKMTVLMEDEGEKMPVTFSVKNGNTHMSMDMNGMAVGMLYRADIDKAYMLIDFLNAYTDVTEDMMGEDFDMTGLTEQLKAEVKGDISVEKGTFEGKSATCESFSDGNLRIKYYFDSKDNILGVEKIDSDGKVDKLVIDGFDTVVEDSLFEIPKGYIYMNLSAFM